MLSSFFNAKQNEIKCSLKKKLCELLDSYLPNTQHAKDLPERCA